MKGVLFLVNKFSIIKIVLFIGILGNRFVTLNKINLSLVESSKFILFTGSIKYFIANLDEKLFFKNLIGRSRYKNKQLVLLDIHVH